MVALNVGLCIYYDINFRYEKGIGREREWVRQRQRERELERTTTTTDKQGPKAISGVWGHNLPLKFFKHVHDSQRVFLRPTDS